MKALLALTLVSLFITQAQAVEDIELKIVSKECNGAALPVDAKEKIKINNGMLVKFSPSVSDDSKSCNQAEVFFLLVTPFTDFEDMESPLLHGSKREVCRDPKSSVVLSDKTSEMPVAERSMKASFSEKTKSGSVVIKNSSECPEGELKIQLSK